MKTPSQKERGLHSMHLSPAFFPGKKDYHERKDPSETSHEKRSIHIETLIPCVEDYSATERDNDAIHKIKKHMVTLRSVVHM